MSFFSNIFGSSSGTTTAAPAATSPTPAPVTQPTPAPAPETPPAEISPLDQFKTLWEPSTTQTTPDATLPANIFAGADPTKMLEAARKVDFAKSIPPEVLAKITAGGPDAAAAFASAINDVSQRSYAQSSFAATKIVEAALAKFQEGIDSRLPGQIKRHAVSDSIRESNPALQHPAAAPIMEALQAQMAVKYPNATVTEIREMAGQYLTSFAGTVVGKPKAEAVPKSEDWGQFFQ